MLKWTWSILGFVYLTIKLFGSLKSGQISQERNRSDSLEILKVRYARGEISQEDYIRMKETLEQAITTTSRPVLNLSFLR